MGYLIKEFKIDLSVDIGVYRGRSLFAQAVAHKKFSKGKVYGIDPYSADAALQLDAPELKGALDLFLAKTNFDDLYNDVISKIKNEGLNGNCELLRLKSDEAAHFFIKNKIELGMVHIDGNHDTNFVMNDVKNYVQLLSEKAFIVLDDVSWKSIKPAFDLLHDRMNYVGKIVNKNNDFALFSRGFEKADFQYLKTVFRVV